jgi:hypothetical protein
MVDLDQLFERHPPRDWNRLISIAKSALRQGIAGDLFSKDADINLYRRALAYELGGQIAQREGLRSRAFQPEDYKLAADYGVCALQFQWALGKLSDHFRPADDTGDLQATVRIIWQEIAREILINPDDVVEKMRAIWDDIPLSVSDTLEQSMRAFREFGGMVPPLGIMAEVACEQFYQRIPSPKENLVHAVLMLMSAPEDLGWRVGGEPWRRNGPMSEPVQ